MACTAKSVKAKANLSLFWTAVISTFLVLSLPAKGNLHHAVELLKQAAQANSTGNAAQATGFLNEAMIQIKNKPDIQWPKGHKEKAIAAVRLALTDMGNNNTTKASTDITEALAVCENQDVGASDEKLNTVETHTPPAPERPVPTVKLTEDQARAVVLIKGDNAEGTGFLVKMPDGPVVITNIHVISNNPNLVITTNTGTPITIVSYKGASDRDLAMIAIKDGTYSYLPLDADISGTVQPGDEVITPGNSEGGEVMLNTDGKVLGIGPDRIEFDNPIYHGNSGGPVIHVKSGAVIGVVTEAIKVDVTDELDKASFANRNSAIGHSMRYFGMRVDTVPKWEPYDWGSFQKETSFLDQFDKRSRALDSLLNAPNDNKPGDILWRDDEKITKAAYNYYAQVRGGADVSQRMVARREFIADLNDIADTDMDTIGYLNNLYSFDQLRAKDEIAYRKALKAELDNTNTNISLLDSASRKNN